MTASTHIVRGRSLFGGALRVLWNVVRAPVLIVLVFCEPIVGVVCAAVMILGVFVSIVFEISAAGPRFPFIGMMAASLGFGVFLLLYHGVIALLME